MPCQVGHSGVGIIAKVMLDILLCYSIVQFYIGPNGRVVSQPHAFDNVVRQQDTLPQPILFSTAEKDNFVINLERNERVDDTVLSNSMIRLAFVFGDSIRERWRLRSHCITEPSIEGRIAPFYSLPIQCAAII